MMRLFTPISAALIIAAAMGFFAAHEGRAQVVGKGYDTSLPIEIAADALEVEQDQGIATFTGNVDAVQGELNLRADKLIVYYRDNAEQSNAIRLIEAHGNVFLSSPSEMAQGENGVYNLDTDKVELTGSVQLTRGDNVIRGDRLDMDLITGKSRVSSKVAGTNDNSQGGGRVKALFVPKGNTGE